MNPSEVGGGTAVGGGHFKGLIEVVPKTLLANESFFFLNERWCTEPERNLHPSGSPDLRNIHPTGNQKFVWLFWDSCSSNWGQILREPEIMDSKATTPLSAPLEMRYDE